MCLYKKKKIGKTLNKLYIIICEICFRRDVLNTTTEFRYKNVVSVYIIPYIARYFLSEQNFQVIAMIAAIYYIPRKWKTKSLCKIVFTLQSCVLENNLNLIFNYCHIFPLPHHCLYRNWNSWMKVCVWIKMEKILVANSPIQRKDKDGKKKEFRCTNLENSPLFVVWGVLLLSLTCISIYLELLFGHDDWIEFIWSRISKTLAMIWESHYFYYLKNYEKTISYTENMCYIHIVCSTILIKLKKGKIVDFIYLISFNLIFMCRKSWIIMCEWMQINKFFSLIFSSESSCKSWSLVVENFKYYSLYGMLISYLYDDNFKFFFLFSAGKSVYLP